MSENAQYTMETHLNNQTHQTEITVLHLSEMYLDTLSPKEKKAYLIAREHLGMSFTIEKSVGFLQWKKQFIR